MNNSINFNSIIKAENLTEKELLEIIDIITSLSNPIRINRIKYKRFTPYSILVMAPSNYKKKNLIYREYTAKLCISPHFNVLSIENADIFFNKYLSSSIECVIRLDSICKSIRTVTIEHGKIFFHGNITSLFEIFKEYPMILKKIDRGETVVFILENLNWEQIKLYFGVLNIRISGGTHSKRQYISPLDIKLIDVIEGVKSYNNDILEKRLSDFGYNNEESFENFIDDCRDKEILKEDESEQVENLYKIIKKDNEGIEENKEKVDKEDFIKEIRLAYRNRLLSIINKSFYYYDKEKNEEVKDLLKNFNKLYKYTAKSLGKNNKISREFIEMKLFRELTLSFTSDFITIEPSYNFSNYLYNEKKSIKNYIKSESKSLPIYNSKNNSGKRFYSTQINPSNLVINSNTYSPRSISFYNDMASKIVYMSNKK